MDFLGQTWVLSKTVVTIANSDPYETILEGNKKKCPISGIYFVMSHYEMPWKVCERYIFHVMGYVYFFEMPKILTK